MAGSNGTNLDALQNMALQLVKAGSVGVKTGDFARALGNAVIEEAIFDSDATPEIRLQPFAPGDPNAPKDAPSEPLSGAVGRFFRPRLRLKMGLGPDVVFAPFGEPSGNPYPKMIGLGAAVAGVTALALGHKKTAVTLGLVSAGAFFWSKAQER